MQSDEKKRSLRFSLQFKSKIILYNDSLQELTDSTQKSLSHIARITDINRRTIGRWI